MSKFDELLGELETLAKAQPAGEGDDKIVAAAAEGGGQGTGEEESEGGDVEGEAEGEGMAKSFEVTLADGTKVQAQDGTALLKALEGRVDETESTMAKALGVAVDLIKSQGAQIAALKASVKAISSEGKGRKAVLSVADKPVAGTLAKSEGADAISPDQFMAKALDAQKAGRLTGLDVSTAEACLNRGQQVPANIVSAVLGA